MIINQKNIGLVLEAAVAYLSRESWQQWALLACCSTAVLGNAGKISFTDLLTALLTCADNSFARVFIFYTCLLYISLHRIIISIHFPLIYAIWWALTHITRSYLCMNEWQRCSFSFTTHILKRVWRSHWGHKYTNIISRTALRVSSWAFDSFIWVKLAHIIYTQKCEGIHGNPSK